MKRIDNVPRKSVLQALLTCGAAALAVGASLYPSISSSQQTDTTSVQTASPIKHVIVIVGENRTFNHVFGAYTPRSGQTVSNLLSKGIITQDGKPGPNFAVTAPIRFRE